MRVVLINLFAPYTGSKYTSGLVNIEPLGLEYIGGVARKAGHDVNILSPIFNETLEEFGERIINKTPAVVGMGPATYNFNQAKLLAKMIKEKQKKTFIIFGGYHVTAIPDVVVDPVIDIAIQGEGEYLFLEIIKCLKKETSYENIHGISYLRGSELVINPRMKRVRHLDKLPYPLRNKQEMALYKCSGVHDPPKSQQLALAQIMYSRGCPHNCSYCSSQNMWENSIVYRKPSSVVDEIQYLMDNFGTNYIFFADLTFNLSKRKVKELCQEIIRRNIRVNWFCGCRPEGIDEELLGYMKEAGCTRVHFGIESIDELSLDKIHRQKTYEHIKKALELTSNKGIITRAYLMIGYPWERREHFETINTNLNKLYIDDLRICFFTPFPGTEIYNEYRSYIETDNWDDYTTDIPIYRIKDMQKDEILEYRNRIFLNYYKSFDFKERVDEKIAKFPRLKISFNEFFKEIDLQKLSFSFAKDQCNA